MQTRPQNVLAPQPRVFNYSLDWRFLLPITDAGRIRVIVGEDSELSQTLEQVRISVSNHFSEIKQTGADHVQALVLPFGLPVRWVGSKQGDQIEFYRSIRHLIDPGGYLLVGFNNSRNFYSNIESKYHPSTPRYITNDLTAAGFKSIKIFGAIPNLSIPEYIVDLDAQAIQFALQHRFRRKPIVLNSLQLLSRALSWARISTFLPCYFAVAVI